MKSTCTSNKHSEYTCLMNWSVTSKKFTVSKWCKECVDKYKDTYVVKKYLEK
jgi:hypothetical protein